MQISKFFLFFTFFMALFVRAQAFPNSEKANLDVNINQASTDITVSPDDRYIYVENGSSLVIIDTATWERKTTQPDAFEDTVTSFAFKSSTELFVVLDGGQLFNFNPSNTAHGDDLLEDDSESRQFDQLKMITNSSTDYLYLLDRSDDVVYKYDIDAQVVTGFFTPPGSGEGEEDLDYELLDMALLDLPNADNEGAADKLLITTDQSTLFFVTTDDMTLSSSLILSGEFEDADDGGDDGCTFTNEDAGNDHNLSAVAIGPNRRIAYVLDSDDNLVYAVDPIDEDQVDTDTVKSGVNPFCIDPDNNNELTDLIILNVSEPTSEIYAYVAGDSGLSLFDAAPNSIGLITDALLDPMTLSSVPSRLAASSLSDAYLYSSNVDGSISVITDNPFIVISAITTDHVDDKITEANTTFDITFQVDEVCDACAYRIIANSSIKEVGGVTLTSGTLVGQLADTDITISDIETDGFDLTEGDNEVFVFVDDAEGNTGRDMSILEVDLPPPDVNIISSTFGLNRGILTVTRLTQADIAQYNIFALAAADQDNPVCPGALDFDAAVINNSIAQADSGVTQDLNITNLTNGTYYCVAVQAQDNSAQLSPTRVAWTQAILPQTVLGILAVSGENPSCGLSLSPAKSSQKIWIFLLFSLVSLLLLRSRRVQSC